MLLWAVSGLRNLALVMSNLSWKGLLASSCSRYQIWTQILLFFPIKQQSFFKKNYTLTNEKMTKFLPWRICVWSLMNKASEKFAGCRRIMRISWLPRGSRDFYSLLNSKMEIKGHVSFYGRTLPRNEVYSFHMFRSTFLEIRLATNTKQLSDYHNSKALFHHFVK